MRTLAWILGSIGALAGAVWPLPSAAAASLELVDGRVLAGMDVWREGPIYVLELDSGLEMALPVELVSRVVLESDGSAEEGEAPDTAAVEESPPRAEALVGADLVTPAPASSMATLGKPANFRRDLVDSRWTPTTDWNMDAGSQNNFNPARWARPPIDPSWKPEPAWDAASDALQDRRSTWSRNIVDSSWQPTDGFASSPANRK